MMISSENFIPSMWSGVISWYSSANLTFLMIAKNTRNIIQNTFSFFFFLFISEYKATVEIKTEFIDLFEKRMAGFNW